MNKPSVEIQVVSTEAMMTWGELHLALAEPSIQFNAVTARKRSGLPVDRRQMQIAVSRAFANTDKEDPGDRTCQAASLYTFTISPPKGPDLVVQCVVIDLEEWTATI